VNPSARRTTWKDLGEIARAADQLLAYACRRSALFSINQGQMLHHGNISPAGKRFVSLPSSAVVVAEAAAAATAAAATATAAAVKTE
jgi:hypothetical protein